MLQAVENRKYEPGEIPTNSESESLRVIVECMSCLML